MIRNLLATTALATLVATAAYTQDQPAPAPSDTMQPAPAEQPAAPVVKADGYLATNIIGESVYNGTGDTAENVGDVNDIVLDKDGKTESVIVGVGGFLGIGERNVAVEFSKLSWAEANGDRWLVYPATREQLEALPEFDRRPYDPTPAPVAMDNTGTAPATTPAPMDSTAQAPAAEPTEDTTAEAPATEPTDDTTAQAPATEPPAPAPTDQQTAESPAPSDQPAAETDTTTTAAIDKSTLTEIPSGEVKAEDLVGTIVYGANDENIGEISDIVLHLDGKVDSMIVDVGGFLGVGEKPVAVGFDNLAFMTDKDGKKYLYTNFTKEQLEAQPAYDKASYVEKRDEQRLMQ